MIFEKIYYELSGNNLKLSAECNGVLAIVEIGRDILIKMFPSEFAQVKVVSYNPIEYAKTTGHASMTFWFDEFMNQKRAEQLFTDSSVDDITEIITND